MKTRDDLELWVHQAVALRGEATIVDVAKYIWANHEEDLRDSGDLFYTWQYDMRWAAQRLRDKGIFKSDDELPRGVWALQSVATAA